LAAINRQHVRENIPAIVLPRNFWLLRPALQLFVITDLERVSRRLAPVVGVTAQLDGWATTGAYANVDPSLHTWMLAGGTHLHSFGSVWGAALNVLDADFLWMYDDGWSAGDVYNADCVTATSAGCWSHRAVILGGYDGSSRLVGGVGSVTHHDAHGTLDSEAEVIADYTATNPKLVYSWAAAVTTGATAVSPRRRRSQCIRPVLGGPPFGAPPKT
jgi:hypothetical protein